MRMAARRAALPIGGSIRKPLAKADAAFRPNPKGKTACGRIASRMYKVRFAHWHQPTALAMPSTAPASQSFTRIFLV
jgi:hypothetical protein